MRGGFFWDNENILKSTVVMVNIPKKSPNSEKEKRKDGKEEREGEKMCSEF